MADWPEGYGRRVLAQVDSTNAEAARIAPSLTAPGMDSRVAPDQGAAGGAGGPGLTRRAISPQPS